jgi:hypothetical protein
VSDVVGGPNPITLTETGTLQWISPNGARITSSSNGVRQESASNTALMSALQSTGRFSVELWVYRDSSVSGSRDIFSFSILPASPGFRIRDHSGTLRVILNGNNYDTSSFFSSTRHYHIVVVWDSSRVFVYRDGIRLGSSAISTNLNTWVSNQLEVTFFHSVSRRAIAELSRAMYTNARDESCS